MRNKKQKKAQFDQVFVYLFSIIVIVFAGFLVTKFVKGFFDDTDKIMENEFYEKFEKDFETVYGTYGSEKIYKYKVNGNIEYVCFVSASNCIADMAVVTEVSAELEDEITMMFTDTNVNIMMFDKDNILNSRNTKKFIVDTENTGQCLCIKPNNGYFELIFENIDNKVHIAKN